MKANSGGAEGIRTPDLLNANLLSKVQNRHITFKISLFGLCEVDEFIRSIPQSALMFHDVRLLLVYFF
jgi:hypothetical protein